MIKHIPIDVVQYETQKEQTKDQKIARITNEINACKKAINDLEEKKKKYQQMKSDSNELLGELKSAKCNITDSKEELKETYSSPNSKPYLLQLDKFDYEVEKINDIIRKLSNTILPEIEKNIEKIDQDIKNRQNIIQDLEIQLSNL